MDFSTASGKYLLTAGVDDERTVSVFRWRDGSLVAAAPGHSLKICHAKFRPDANSRFVTAGIKHVKFWTVISFNCLLVLTYG